MGSCPDWFHVLSLEVFVCQLPARQYRHLRLPISEHWCFRNWSSIPSQNEGLKGAVYLVSLKALAEEKYSLFRRFWTAGDEQILRTAITTGDRDFEDEGLSQSQVTFATYEKFYAMIRDNPELLSHVSLIVVDELQTLGDTNRGSVLEMLLTLVIVRNPQTQIIGLSAALPNADDLGGWLGAKVCRTTKRDIPLIEEIWTKSTVYSKEFGQGYDAIQERPNLA